MSTAAIPPKGVLVPAPTFFSASKISTSYGEHPLDLSAQIEHSIHLARSGISGIVLLGSTGESVHVTRPERITLISGVIKGLEEVGFKDYPIMAGTATNSIEETVELCKESAAAGAKWMLVLAPSYFASAGGYPEEGLIMWYTAVADNSPVPILVYNYPGVSNNIALAPSVYEKLSKHPNIVGCKLSHGNMSHSLIISSIPNFISYTGLGQHLFPFLAAGGSGAIDGLAGFFPKTMVRLYKLVKEVEETGGKEKWEEARKLQVLVSRGEEWVVKFGTIGIKEATARILGIGKGDGGRLPFMGMEHGVVETAWASFLNGPFGELSEMEAKL